MYHISRINKLQENNRSVTLLEDPKNFHRSDVRDHQQFTCEQLAWRNLAKGLTSQRRLYSIRRKDMLYWDEGGVGWGGRGFSGVLEWSMSADIALKLLARGYIHHSHIHVHIVYLFYTNHCMTTSLFFPFAIVSNQTDTRWIQSLWRLSPN